MVHIALENHTSWDWLKPAIDKFLRIDIVRLNYDVEAYTFFKKARTSLANMTISHSIDYFYNELLAAIKVHNSQH